MPLEESTYNGWVGHRPLRCPTDAVVQAPFVCIVTAIRVSQEEGIDVPSLEKLSKINPILKVALFSRFITWVLQGKIISLE
jgi:hypothetical protein